MKEEELRERIPVSEFNFLTSRSGGPGGQNVNKVNTKVELRFNISNSSSLSEREKERIFIILKNRINSEAELIIVSQSERSQTGNRKKVTERFFKLVSSALTEKIERRKTNPTKASQNERLEKKKQRATIKKLRQGHDHSHTDE